MFRAVAVTCVVAVVGCFGSGMESASQRTGRNPRSDGVLDQAARETGCPVNDLRIVAETGRRYVNETAFRFVLEGCGERLGFVEQCELDSSGPGTVAVNDSLGCRYILVSRLPLRPTPPG
ncbi:MAG: hypothetical protein K0S65_3634 [Labilithrix sp.]|nr:hypothetical protein [Labilithrix sp.]